MEKLNINNRRYLGSKFKLVDFIKKIVNENCKNYSSFLDIFGGTGVVANAFIGDNKKIYINDILKSNYFSYNAWFGSEKINNKNINKIIDEFNSLDKVEDNYFSKNFGNTYFSYNDCKKIGFIREKINELYNSKKINTREKYILITSLLYSMDRIANTVGHYDAYRKISNLKDRFFMYKLDANTENKNVEIFNIDSNKLVRNVSADIVYIDPPYNSRQYCDAYHLLENIAEWKKPNVYGVAKKMDRKQLKSDYCTNKASNAFSDLIENIKAKYILVSYNNMGENGDIRSQAKITDEEMIEILSKKGKVEIFETSYGYFTTGKTALGDHKERIFLCTVGKKNDNKNIISKNKLNDKRFIKSPINYIGGKHKLLDQIIINFPENINNFIDVFCGGFNVGINVKANNIIAIDSQKELIRTLNLFKNYSYLDITKDIENIIIEYKLSNSFSNGYKTYNCSSDKGLGSYNKSRYIKLREYYNTLKNNSYKKDIVFLTLIFYSFNNQIRFNSNKKFNMPVGKRDFNSSIRRNLLEFCNKLKDINIEFMCNDFRIIEDLKDKNNFFYFDPPYYLGTATYNENNAWTEKDENDLLNLIEKISKHNKFALSNVIEHKGKKHDLLANWCIKNKFNIKYLNYNYNNSNYHSNNKDNKTIEVLITNY